MFRVNHMTRCVAAACSALAGAAFVPASLAQAPAQQQPQQLDRVEITGSAIRRTQQEGPAPVEIITRKEIERTGATSINELIKSIATIDIFDQGELTNNSPSGSGTSVVAIRGLSSLNVLVLLNGRRLPVNALYDSTGAGAAVDVNMIPVSAIERIEILKDGGSAIYGADAVTGVINFITKRDYQGIEARAGYGVTSRNDGKETSAGIAGGFGDLNSQRFNVFAALDYFKRDPIYRKDRNISRSVDFRHLGGADNRSTFAPQGNWASSTTFGTISAYTPCAPADQDTAGRCRYDFNASILPAYNGADRLSFLSTANFLVTKEIRAFAEAVYSKSEDQFVSHPAPDFFLIPTAAFAPNAILPPPAAADATSLGAPGFFLVGGRFLQAGNRTTDRESTLLQTSVGMDGTHEKFDWKFHVGRGVSEVTNSDSNYLDANAVFNAISAGQINPTVTTNNQAIVDALKVRPVRTGKSTLDTASAQLSGDALNLPAGPLRYAVGLSWLKEELTDTPDPLTQAGAVLGSIQQAAVQASRTNKAFFTELSVPVTRSIEAQLAGRYDDYPRETASSFKAALKYQPVSNLLLRASYAESFRAPSLKQLFGAQEEGAINITDDDLCVLLGATAPCNISAFNVNGSNPDLKSETGETVNIGIVFDVGSAFAASLDFWRIYKKDSISTPTIATAVQEGRFNTSGGRLRVFTNLQNIAEVTTSGFDLDMKFRATGTAIGNITVRDQFTYYYHVQTRSSSRDDWAEFVSTYVTPRFRNVLSLLAEKGPWSTQFLLRTTAGFYDTDRPWPVVTQRKVGSHEELDVQVSYSGFKGLTLTGGVKNLLDNMPPFSQQNANNNAYSQMGFAELYTSRGAFYYANVAYKFR